VQAARKAGRTVDEVIETWVTPAKYQGYSAPNPAVLRVAVTAVWNETK
jgi:hypothetical protein